MEGSGAHRPSCRYHSSWFPSGARPVLDLRGAGLDAIFDDWDDMFAQGVITFEVRLPAGLLCLVTLEKPPTDANLKKPVEPLAPFAPHPVGPASSQHIRHVGTADATSGSSAAT